MIGVGTLAHLGTSNACNTDRCRAVDIIGLIVMVRTRLERWDSLGEFFWWGESERCSIHPSL